MVDLFFFFQAEDGIRDAQESRGLGDVYKRQARENLTFQSMKTIGGMLKAESHEDQLENLSDNKDLSLIHI